MAAKRISATTVSARFNKCTFQGCIGYVDIAGCSSARIRIQCAQMAIFNFYTRKYLAKQEVILSCLLLTINMKFHIVDLLQISLLGAFTDALISCTYLCIS